MTDQDGYLPRPALTVSILTSDEAVEEIQPSFLVPTGSTSSTMVLSGQVLELECIAAGL